MATFYLSFRSSFTAVSAAAQSPAWQEGDRHAEKASARDDVMLSFLVGMEWRSNLLRYGCW